MAGNSSFKIKWLEKPEYKCLSQIQNKFKAASCNVCIKDINISNIAELQIKKNSRKKTRDLRIYDPFAMNKIKLKFY
jgi:hypothetical protein